MQTADKFIIMRNSSNKNALIYHLKTENKIKTENDISIKNK
jgi:hypothetical protein